MAMRLFTATMAVYVTLGFLAQSVLAEPAKPDDFGPDSETVDFDHLPAGIALADQLRISGITVRADKDATLFIVDEATAGTELPSLPLALQADDENATIEFRFTPSRQAVGFSFLLPAGETLLLQVYDDQNKFLEQVAVTSTALLSQSRAVSPADFIGIALANPGIAVARVSVTKPVTSPIIDDLLVQASNAAAVDLGPYLSILTPGGKPDQKLDAINALLLLPSPQTSDLLLDVAKNDPDSYIRENALLALAQYYDIGALAKFVDIALNDVDPHVGSAARNAVHVLRQQWPIPDPPEIEFTATGPFTVGVPFMAEVVVTSPVQRQRVLMRHQFRDGIVPAPDTIYGAYESSAQSGVPIVWQVELMPESSGRAELELVVELTLNLVDYASYRKTLYFEIDEGGGSVSSELFPDAPPAEDKELPMGGPNQ